MKFSNEKVIFRGSLKFLFVFSVLFFNILFLAAEDVSRGEESQPAEDVHDSKINIYIENSYSMLAYYEKQGMNLSNSIESLITHIKKNYPDMPREIYSIAGDSTNSLTKYYESNDMDFIFDIKNSQFRKNEKKCERDLDDPRCNFKKAAQKCTSDSKDPRCNTELNHTIEKILQETKSRSVSFFISDLIYSIEKSKVPSTMLPKLQTKTTQVFLDKSREDYNFSVVLIQLKVKFDGIYYDYNDVPSEKHGIERPIFILAMGNKDVLLKLFGEKNKLSEEINNFQNIAYFFTNNNYEKSVFTVLPVTDDEDSYPSNPGRVEPGDPVQRIYRYNEVNKISIAAQINCLNKDPEVKENYAGDVMVEIADKTSDETNKKHLIIEKVETFDKLNNETNKKFVKQLKNKGFTYVLNLKKEAGLKTPSNLKIYIIDDLPKWIDISSTEDDTKLDKTKTFGLKYFANGVKKGLQGNDSKDDYCFSIDLGVGYPEEDEAKISKENIGAFELLLTLPFDNNPDNALFSDFPALFGKISSAFFWFFIVLLFLPLLFNVLYFKVIEPSSDKMAVLCLTMLVSSLFCYLINIVLALCLSDLEILSSSFALLLIYLFTIPMLCSVIWFFVLSFAGDWVTKLGVWKIRTDNYDNLSEEEEDE